MYSVGQLAKRFGLSRSTLLYYDSIGLLTPSGRVGANYRQYSEEDYQRLGRICNYRAAGISLQAIKQILDSSSADMIGYLEKRLSETNSEIEHLRKQQCYIVALMQASRIRQDLGVVTIADLDLYLDGLGIEAATRHEFHQEMERDDPDRHRSLLESIGLSDTDIAQVKARSQADK